MSALEDAIRPADPTFTVTCFRAGTYEAQPFRRLHDALAANGLHCDSSVYAGGRRDGRNYDFRLAYSDHQPYFASRYDPQLKAPPAERALVELPIFAPRRNERWTFDFSSGVTFAKELLDWRRAQEAIALSPRRAELAPQSHEAPGSRTGRCAIGVRRSIVFSPAA